MPQYQITIHRQTQRHKKAVKNVGRRLLAVASRTDPKAGQITSSISRRLSNDNTCIFGFLCAFTFTPTDPIYNNLQKAC